MVNEVYKLQISRECIFPIDNIAHVHSRKTFYHISVNFQNPVFIFRTGRTTISFFLLDVIFST